MHPLISATGISKSYRTATGRLQVLYGVNFSVYPGQFVAIVGQSGSGKSTLLYSLSGLTPINQGSVSIAGKIINGVGKNALAAIRREHVGFIFQDFNLVSALNVADNVALPSVLAGKKPTKEQVRYALNAVGLEKVERKHPHKLSGGQRQRVAIARTLLRQPDIIFADEPTGSLDVTTGRHIMDLLHHAVTPTNCVVMVTHDLELASTADRVCVLNHGRVEHELITPTSQEVFAALHQH